MISVAIVEDEDAAAESLQRFLKKYEADEGTSFVVTRYSNVGQFLEPYHQVDLVFMDIMMPGLNGMQGARLLREVDPEVKLIFVTNMAQFAVQGYEVNALDFVVKPVSYKDFCFKLKRAVAAVENSRKDLIDIQVPQGLERISERELMYVDVEGHTVTYHLRENTIEVRGSMKQTETLLTPWKFLRCNNCYLVNPRYIEWVHGYEVKVGDAILQISHPRKKKFMEDLAAHYMGGEG